MAYDITLQSEGLGEEGENYQPEKKVEVTIANEVIGAAVEAGQELKVYHIDDEGNATEVKNVTVDGDTISFKADSFSIYAVVTEGTDARLLVKFVGLNGAEIDSMYVKQGDNMEQVLYDPGVGELVDGIYFRGWTRNEGYTSDTDPLSIEGVRSAVTALLSDGVTDADSEGGDSVTYYAMLFKDYRITYFDENNISLGQEEVTFRADSTTTELPYTVNMAYTVQDDEHHFEGWNVVEGGNNISGHESGTLYQNNDEITITGDVSFGVNAPAGHWFIFDENGKGAAYNAPQFVYSNDKPTRPSNDRMIRNGYTFGGWFIDKTVADQTSGGTEYNFDQTLTDKVTVYAR